jgi:carotenoid 1,2-hydratase
MPTLPLYVPPPQQPFADGWHQVTAPGGYEWWHFDAEDPATDTQLVAMFAEGFVFHSGYIRAYERYRRRPTRIQPPLPRDYICAYFVVYRGGKILHQFITQYPAGEFAAATDRLDVRVGPNHCRAEVDGTIRLTLKGTPWVLTGRGPQTLAGRTLSAELAFTPKLSHAPMERTFFSRAMTGADHHWVLANPLCDVTGSVLVTGDEPMTFHGRGYHDHNYGSAPIGLGVREWMCGRVLLDDRVMAFHLASANNTGTPRETHLVEASQPGPEEKDQEGWSVGPPRRSSVGLHYPDTFRYRDQLLFQRPRLIDVSPFYLRVTYEAWNPSTRPGTAFCEIAYPHRLRWPVLGRMIEMSIDKRPWRAGDGGAGAS